MISDAHDNLNQHLQGSDSAKAKQLSKSIAAQMEPRPGQYIRVGQMEMWQTQRGSIWLQPVGGQGTEVPLTRLETMLRQLHRKQS